MKEWIFLIIGAIIGYLTSLFFYLKSKKSSHKRNLDKLFILYEHVVKNSLNISVIKEIKEEIGTKNKMDDIYKELITIKTQLEKFSNPIDIIKYKLLGDKWSDEYLKSINPKILTKEGLLYFKNILEFHKSIFPSGFPWSGKIRFHNVVITNTFGTVLPSLTQGTVNYNINPINPSDISKSMDKFCNEWNSNFKIYLTRDNKEKINKASKYHHEFQIIHPFMDGNGRIGRIILNDMLEFLLNKKIDFNYDREEYYSALKFADMGDLNRLNEFIYKQIIKLF